MIVGVLATVVAGFLVFVLWAASDLLGFGSGVYGWSKEIAPPVGVLLVMVNLTIGRVAPVWVTVAYAVAATTAVTLPFFSPAGDVVYWAWALGVVGLLGTALGVRPLRAPEPKRREGCPEPPPTNGDE
ncbi:MAG: hypothetical protein LBK59_04450 [Bifidobacteriaceae bacterium]|nr:hypothetical protein [Bifidobacteriaceae bacterium]